MIFSTLAFDLVPEIGGDYIPVVDFLQASFLQKLLITKPTKALKTLIETNFKLPCLISEPFF